MDAPMNLPRTRCIDWAMTRHATITSRVWLPHLADHKPLLVHVAAAPPGPCVVEKRFAPLAKTPQEAQANWADRHEEIMGQMERTLPVSVNDAWKIWSDSAERGHGVSCPMRASGLVHKTLHIV